MKKAPAVNLTTRLSAYTASLRSSQVNETRSRHRTNWRAYAAVTGSALAMATSASASMIVQNINQTISIGSATANNGFHQAATLLNVVTPTSGKQIGSVIMIVDQFVTNGIRFGTAGLANDGGAKGLFVKSFAQLSALSQAQRNQISAGSVPAGNLNSGHGELFVAQRASDGLFQPGVPGFAGFAFSYNGHTDYGWIELQLEDGPNGSPDSITASEIGYYDSSLGNAPEPSTGALALLAAGAAGVVALRRRRKSPAA